MKKIITSVFFLSLVVSCSNKGSVDFDNYQTKQVIYIENKNNSFDIIYRIGDIYVLNLNTEDSWVYLNYPKMIATDDRYFFLTDKTYYLIGYEKNGNLLFSKQIKGRGRGEVINVGNFFLNNDTLMVFDKVLGRILRYTKDGEFCSYLNRSEITADKLYNLDHSYFGLSIFTDNDKDGNYCIIFDENGNRIRSYLTLPQYLVGYNATVGRTDMSYVYHDTLRFMLNHNYHLFSFTKNGVESTYRFKSSKEMPKDYFGEISGFDLMDPKISGKIASEGFTHSFSGLFETDKYIIVSYYLNNTYSSLLYDKTINACGTIIRPNNMFVESLVPELTTLDIWKYIWFSFTRLCVNDNTVYGCIPFSLYQILSSTESLFDEKIKTFYDELKKYVLEQDISAGDMIFIKMDLL